MPTLSICISQKDQDCHTKCNPRHQQPNEPIQNYENLQLGCFLTRACSVARTSHSKTALTVPLFQFHFSFRSTQTSATIAKVHWLNTRLSQYTRSWISSASNKRPNSPPSGRVQLTPWIHFALLWLRRNYNIHLPLFSIHIFSGKEFLINNVSFHLSSKTLSRDAFPVVQQVSERYCLTR